MSATEPVGRRTRVAGALAGAVAVAAVVVAVVVGSRAPDAAGTPQATPTVAAATADAAPTDPTSATAGAAPSDASVASTTPGTDLLPQVQEVVDVVLELESGNLVTAPVRVGTEVEVLPGVRVAVDGARPVDGQAAGPGESSGPALAIDVRLTNGSGEAVSADGLVVNVYGADAVPGSPLLGDPRSAPLQGDIAGGASAQGVYVLTGPGGTTAGPHVVSVALGAGTTTALVVLTQEAG